MISLIGPTTVRFSLVATFAMMTNGAVAEASNSYQNVYGDELQSCSSDGMALTGYTRNGYCVDRNDDQGSHHICIDMSSAEGGNFCTVTGQSDWCSDEMPCHEDQSQYCQVQHWCVCQGAFASYLQNTGGCDQIQEVVCESINLQALLAYQEQSQTSKYATALSCLVDRCGLAESQLEQLSLGVSSSGFSNILKRDKAIIASALVVLALVIRMALSYHERYHRKSQSAGVQQSLMDAELSSGMASHKTV